MAPSDAPTVTAGANNGSTYCFYWASNRPTDRHPDLEPVVNLQRQLQHHLVTTVFMI